MSLVNDMLRDLEARRAAPAEREQLGGMYAVDEAATARRERFERMRRWVLVLTAMALVAIPLGLFIERLLGAQATVADAPVAVPTAAAPAATRLLDVLPQKDGNRFVLQLVLDRSVGYQRTDEGGAVSLRLPGVELVGDARSGRIEKDGLSLSWRVEQQGDQVQVLLIGMMDRLDIGDRLESAGGHWQLWLETKMNAAPTGEAVDLQDLPLAEPALDEAALPEWVTRTAPDEQAPAPSTLRETERASVQAVPQTVQQPVSARPFMQIGSHRPDALSEAREALQQANYPRAIELLQSLHAAQPDNSEATRWLARAYLAAGDGATLLDWLPAQLQRKPFDAELRMLLARGQLLNGDNLGALATLKQNPPALASDPAYHALLAALYQQVGDWAGSAAVYRQLVNAHGQQAAWQLGLAIAFEQLDQPAQAARHYRLALQGQGLDGNARRFAEERAGALGGKR
ncbi:tetratricopeptide repeat protein [Pseudomonas lopnurensis]|uniref:tetratricopeptide repeat protein n=1 Tax=Pseudomonas lopnurensis TaxID=1477517 RepID=UPI001879C5AF|nr:tetratricopeptide repeat protein [Pseudomonas lopnurensis]MBE7374780.1 tetratricopeptide repeat protein [Pseudomonas lopnurensis]